MQLKVLEFTLARVDLNSFLKVDPSNGISDFLKDVSI
jgi:hypothetical protein